MLPDTQEKDWHVGRVHNADQGADHVADGIALGDDKSIQRPAGTECGVEVSRLGDRVGPDECLQGGLAMLAQVSSRFVEEWAKTDLANHQNFVGVRKLGKFLQAAHQSLIVVSPTGGVDQNHIVSLLSGEGNSILSYVCSILAVAFLVQFNFTALARCQFREIANMHSKLLYSTRAEGITSGDEDLILVL